jgi:hypothetical protein
MESARRLAKPGVKPAQQAERAEGFGGAGLGRLHLREHERAGVVQQRFRHV